MKKFLLTLCVVSLPLHAQIDFTNNDKRDINDLMYLPNGGTFFGQTSLSAIGSTQDVSLNGNKYYKEESSGTSASQVVGYSITDRFSLSANLEYDIKTTTKDDFVSSSNQTSDSKGLGDPSIGGKFRLIDQKEGPFNLDIIPTYTFSSGPSKSDGNSGDNKAGGSSYSLDVQGGKKFKDLQVMAGIGWTHNNISHSKDTSTGTKSESPANDNFNLNLGVQKFLKEKLYLNLSGILNIYSPVNQDLSSGGKLKTPTRAMSIFAGTLGYLILPNMTFEGSLALASLADYKSKASNGDTYSIEHQSTALINAALKYQF